MLEINELDVIGKRKLDYIPDHFVKIKINESVLFESGVEDWIKIKLKGRYAISNCPFINNTGNLKVAEFAAFEDSKELTYFMLACPFFRRF
jgi:hypothetical protein